MVRCPNLKVNTVSCLFRGHFVTITKTRLFKYIENFTTKKGKFLDKKL